MLTIDIIFINYIILYSFLLLRVDVCRGCSEADLRTRAGLQLLEVLQRRRLIRKQVEARGRIFGELNAAIGEPVVEPMGGDPETPGELGDRQTTRPRGADATDAVAACGHA